MPRRGPNRRSRERIRGRNLGVLDRSVLAFLRTRPLFAGAAPEDLARLLEPLRRIRLRPGEFLFRSGDPPQDVYVVEEGLLEILHEHPESQARLHVQDVRRGRVVGELGVMRGSSRAASVRAVESSQLVAIPGRDFVAFVRKTPSAAMRLAELLAERVAPPVVSSESNPAGAFGEVWGVERTADVDAAFAAALARATWRADEGTPPPTVWCAEGARTPLGKNFGLSFEPLTEVLRPGPGQVALVLGSKDSLMRLGGELKVLIASRPSPPPGVERYVRLTRTGPMAPGTVRWEPGQLHQMAERVVRILEGRTIGLALGGGGALGMCHIGVMTVLARERIPVDVLVGTSAGALMGGIVLVRSLSETAKLARSFTRARLVGLVDPSFFVSGLIEGKRILKYFRELVGDAAIEDLPIPFAALALDLETGEERALGGGPLAEALRASVSLPSVFAPFAYDGEEGRVPGGTYIDAGGVNNVPVDVARELGADRVIGVNVINRPHGWTRKGPPWRNWSPVTRGKMLAYAEMIGFARNGERQVFTADVPILPDTRDFRFTQFYRADALIEAGKRAAEQLVPQLRGLLKP